MSPNTSIIAKRQSFTLVELLMVTIILSMGVYLATPNMMGSYRKARLEKAAREIVLANRYARILAIEEQTPIHLKIDMEKNELQIIKPVATQSQSFSSEGVLSDEGDDLGESSTSQASKDPLFKVKKISDDIRIFQVQIIPLGQNEEQSLADSSQIDKHQITFRPDGSNDKATIVLGQAPFLL
ncbi:MAG: hypothetical protein HQL32_18380, partial [Planctomycetes bacterium]|nr:hypothetical protein [Planctomycetota bacterium]